MKTFLIHSLGDADTTWIVNAKSKKEAIQYVESDDEFYKDEENVVSCDEINNHREGVVYICVNNF